MRRMRGFTLIEMLVAMAIFSALVAVLVLGYRQGLMLWEKGQQQTHRWLKLEFRYRLLDTLITQAVISDDEVSRGLFIPYFKGTKTSMQLISAAPLMDMPGHVRPVALQAVQADDGTWQLRYREGRRYSDPGRGLVWDGKWMVLLNGLRNISFRFEAPAFPLPPELDVHFLSVKERKRYRDTPQWLTAYDTHALWKYPRRVSIRFTDADGGRHAWMFTPPRWPDAWTMEAYSSDG